MVLVVQCQGLLSIHVLDVSGLSATSTATEGNISYIPCKNGRQSCTCDVNLYPVQNEAVAGC